MNTWLIHIGEPLPTDGQVRLFRYGLLAKQLLARGHRVTQWAGTLNHFVKQQRAEEDTLLSVEPGYDIRLMHGPAFQKNVGLGRLRYQKHVAKSFDRQAAEAERPDLIVASLPTIELAERATRFGQHLGIPVIVDVRDLWPDIFANVLPGPVRPLAWPWLARSYAASQRALADATAITGVSESYLDWGLRRAGRRPTSQDRAFAHGYEQPNCDPTEAAQAREFWDQLGVTQGKGLRCCFFGSLGSSCHLDPFLVAFQRLAAAGQTALELVVCGDGPRRDYFRRLSADCPLIRWVDWIDQPKITELMRRSDVGIAAYGPDAPQSLPNKPIEYLAGGLALLSTLAGSDLQKLLEASGSGVTLTRPTAQQIESQLVRWLDSPQTVRRYQEAALSLFEERFHAATVYGSMAEHLESLAESATTAIAA